MVVAFMLLHSVSKCKKCLKFKIYLFEVLKNFLKDLNMLLRSLGAKLCLGIFLEFSEPSKYFSRIVFNFKNGMITKNKISSNSSNIYGWNRLVEPFPNFETPFPV
jgi:hypothetical protein